MNGLKREDYAMCTIELGGTIRYVHGYNIVGVIVDGEFYCPACGFRALGRPLPKSQIAMREVGKELMRSGEPDHLVNVRQLREFYDGGQDCSKCGCDIVFIKEGWSK